MTFNILLAIFLLATAAHLLPKAAPATYIVGDTLGWSVPPTAATYTTYASQHTFLVGDVLVFNFPTGIHDVARVSKASYDSCSSNNAVALATLGPASFSLNSTGLDYYICTFGQHCALGQKLAINVASTAPHSAPPTPPPTTSITPSLAPPRVLAPTTSPALTPSSTPSTTSPALTPSSTPTTSPALAPSEYMGSPAPSEYMGGSPSSDLPSSPQSDMPGLSPVPSSSSTGDLSPPSPPRSNAMRTNLLAPLVIFASLAISLML